MKRCTRPSLILPLVTLLLCSACPSPEETTDDTIVILDTRDMSSEDTSSMEDLGEMSPDDMEQDPPDQQMQEEPDLMDMNLDMASDQQEDQQEEMDLDVAEPACGDDACDAIAWSDGPALAVARDHHMTFLHGEGDEAMLFVAGGFLEGTPPVFLSEVWGAPVLGDGSLGAWQAQPSLPLNLAGSPVIQRNNTVMLVGGRATTEEGLALSYRVYAATLGVDGIQGDWEQLESFPVARFHHSVAQSTSHAYIMGGLEINDPTATVYMGEFDEQDRITSWSQTSSMPEPKTHHASFYHKGYVYVTGGMNMSLATPNVVDTVYRAPVQLFTNQLGSWEAYGTLPTPIATHAHTIYEGYVYSFGGLSANGLAGFRDSVWRAALIDDGGLGPWEVLDEATLPRVTGHTHHVPIWKDHAYLVSGGQRLTLSDQVHIGAINARR